MDAKVNYAAVGLFVLVLGAALIAVTLWLVSGGGFGKSYVIYQAIVDESVSGLSVNAPVKYNGVEVGQVKTIRLDKDNPQVVRLLFALEEGTPVKEDTLAVLKTQGLTGIAYVELSGGSPQSPMLKARAGEEYPTIPTKPSLAARLENVLSTVLANLDRTSNNINALLSAENQASLKNTLADVAAVARTIAARRGDIEATMANASRAFEAGARVADQFGPVVERIGRSAEALEKMATAAEQASRSAGLTSDAAREELRRIAASTVPELQSLVGDVRTLTASLRRLSDRIEASPGGILFGRRTVRPGPGEEAAAR